MARHRRMLAPINANKHYVGQTFATLASSAIVVKPIADAVVAPASSTAFDVEEGSVVKAIFVEIWLSGAGVTGQQISFSITVEKLPSNVAQMTFTQSANLGAYTNKKNILYTTQGILGSAESGNQSVPLIRQWIAIPKGKQRMGLGDRLVLNISNLSTISINHCGMFIYKEYR